MLAVLVGDIGDEVRPSKFGMFMIINEELVEMRENK